MERMSGSDFDRRKWSIFGFLETQNNYVIMMISTQQPT